MYCYEFFVAMQPLAAVNLDRFLHLILPILFALI